MTDFTTKLPNGGDFWVRVGVTGYEATGVLALVITSSISALAVVICLGSIAISAWNTRKSVNPHMFVRSHAAAYLISLLICDFLQALGSLMNARWYMNQAVDFEPFCVAQGVIKQVSDVGSAIWSLIIAIHTFWVLFLRFNLHRYVMVSTLIFGWSLIGVLTIAGPATLDVKKNGPFFAISGYWCWISDHYPVARITLDYMWMFVSAFLSFILYVLVFLRLRGNLLGDGLRMHFRKHHSTDVDRGLSVDSQTIAIAKQMLLYPIAYTAIILPIAICRFTSWAGHEVPFWATIFSAIIFLLSGIINVTLFFATRRVLPKHSVITTRLGREPIQDPELGSELDCDEKPDFRHDGVMFKRVDSPDSDYTQDMSSYKSSNFSVPVETLTKLAPIKVSPGLGRGFGHGSLDDRTLTNDREHYPVSGTGLMLYPQSPVVIDNLRSSWSPTTPPKTPKANRF